MEFKNNIPLLAYYVKKKNAKKKHTAGKLYSNMLRTIKPGGSKFYKTITRFP